jgi:hypothetical protein
MGGDKASSVVFLLSCLRFMDSSSHQVCSLANAIQGKLSSVSVSSNQEILCHIVQFFNHKRCSDSPAILNLRDIFIDLMNISKREGDVSMFSQKVVEHMLALHSKRTSDEDMAEVYKRFTMNIIDPKSPHSLLTPNIFCIGLLGLDSLVESEGLPGVAAFCDQLDSCSTPHTLQQVMLSLSAVDNLHRLHENRPAMDLILNSLTKKLNVTSANTKKPKFQTLMSSFRSLAALCKVSDAAIDMYPPLTSLLAKESFSQHRVSKVLQVLEESDTSRSEISGLLDLLLLQLRACSSEKYDRKATPNMVDSLLSMGDSDVVQALKIEVVDQFKFSGPNVDTDVHTIDDLRLFFAKQATLSLAADDANVAGINYE